jgi:hypothetical protein
MSSKKGVRLLPKIQLIILHFWQLWITPFYASDKYVYSYFKLSTGFFRAVLSV